MATSRHKQCLKPKIMLMSRKAAIFTKWSCSLCWLYNLRLPFLSWFSRFARLFHLQQCLHLDCQLLFQSNETEREFSRQPTSWILSGQAHLLALHQSFRHWKRNGLSKSCYCLAWSGWRRACYPWQPSDCCCNEDWAGLVFSCSQQSDILLVALRRGQTALRCNELFSQEFQESSFEAFQRWRQWCTW